MSGSLLMRLSAALSCIVIGLVASVALTGCASAPYCYGVTYPARMPDTCVPTGVEIAQGRPNKVVDGVGWVFGLPERVVLWNWRAGNHRVSDGTQMAVGEYLVKNNLADVKMRVNQYDPVGEFRRLGTNKRMGAGVRYTLGTVSVLSYSLIPGRVFGGDYYNPYTNTLNIYSDVPAIAVQEAAYAKDVHNRKYPGAYAAVNELPLFALWHDTVNTKDAIGYFNLDGSIAQQREAYHVLGPRFGLLAGGTLSRSIMRPAEGVFVVGEGPISLAGALVGHVVGRVKAPTTNQPPSMLSEVRKPNATPIHQVNHEVTSP